MHTHKIFMPKVFTLLFPFLFIVKVYGCSMSSVFMLQTSIGEDLKTSFDGRDSDISECIDQFSLQFDNIEEARWLERMASASASYGMGLCIQSLSSFSFGTFSTLFQQNFWQSYKLTTSALVYDRIWDFDFRPKPKVSAKTCRNSAESFGRKFSI